MLLFDSECDVIRLTVGQPDPILDVLEAPHVLLRPDGLLVRELEISKTLRTLRLTKGGGLFVCKNDDIIVQSLDVRSIAHMVPLIIARGDLAKSSAPSMISLESWHRQEMAAPMVARPVMDEGVARTSLAMVWPRRVGEPLASLCSSTESLASNASFVAGPNGSFSNDDAPSPLLRAMGGAAAVVAVRHDIEAATERSESMLPLNSVQRGTQIANRALAVDFLTRKQALKFFEAVHGVLRQHSLPLSMPQEPRFVEPHAPEPSKNEVSLLGGPTELSESQKRRLRNRLLARGGESEQSDDSNGSDGSSSRSGSQGGAAGDKITAQQLEREKATTETSTHLRDMFERDDDDDDDERREAERRRRLALTDTAAPRQQPVQEDTLKRESTAAAQEMIERLTAMKVILKNPFVVTEAPVENSQAQAEERRLLHNSAHHPLNVFPSEDSGQVSAMGASEIVTFHRLERSKNPVPVFEALRARRPEHFTREGAAEFFQLCRELYRKERDVLSHRMMSLELLRREGFDSLQYFTGPAIKSLFQSWALQRKREGYQLQQYLVELTQYLWYLKRCEHAEGGAEAADAAPPPEDAEASTTISGERQRGVQPYAPSLSSTWTKSGNPLALYAASSTVAQQLDHCRALHFEIEQLLRARKERYASAGIVDPLSLDPADNNGELRGGQRHRSNIFPDVVAESFAADSVIAPPSRMS